MKWIARFPNLAALAVCGLIATACSSGTPEAIATATSEPDAVAPATTESVAAPIAGVRRYMILPDASTASYIVEEEFFGGALAKYGIPAGAGETVGSTKSISGQLELNLDDLSSALGSNEFTVDLSTLSSDQSLRDQWIRRNGPSFDRFPTATFVGTSVVGAPTSYSEGNEVNFELRGDMTIREITNPVTFEVTAALSGDLLSGTATSNLLLTDFGIEPPNFANTLTVADEFEIRLEFTARQE